MRITGLTLEPPASWPRSYPDTAGWTDADWDAYLGLARNQQ